jgi:hypothetical protein
MNRDDICRMAEESTPDQMIGGFGFDYEQLLHFAALVAAAEREACAKVCESARLLPDAGAAYCAFAIRERGATWLMKK